MSCQGFQTLEESERERLCVHMRTLEVPGQPTSDEYLHVAFASKEKDSGEEPST